MTTESKIYWGVGIVSVLIFFGAFFIPGESRRGDDVPWHIEHPTPDSVRVFGLTLGQSGTNDAEARFKEEAVPSLFKSPEGKLVAAEMDAIAARIKKDMEAALEFARTSPEPEVELALQDIFTE